MSKEPLNTRNTSFGNRTEREIPSLGIESESLIKALGEVIDASTNGQILNVKDKIDLRKQWKGIKHNFDNNKNDPEKAAELLTKDLQGLKQWCADTIKSKLFSSC